MSGELCVAGGLAKCVTAEPLQAPTLYGTRWLLHDGEDWPLLDF
jgi:hypothetical protein